ncbi:Putative glycosyltransferase 2, nucleotide-diphospho-sugar transferase [Septoria linicola]|uniref:Glycosyltransferase 2, nucleotide-diphospho-sugar transferase n=1 Tax=Septoria linicola TaxID=215465 RepID=A0A9Q9AUN4_9PEZI|nr:Putative glycosyltransferase 2, nucleotide-diphospho-sugar transferase [Septoria linicola]
MASTYVWTTRCIPAFSICAVVTLLLCSFIISPHGKGQSGEHNGQATIPQLILSGYTVFCHVMSIAFPVRVCWAIRDVLRRTRQSALETPNTTRHRSHSVKRDSGTFEQPVPLFVIILPAYKEEMSTLEETLKVLGSHTQARSSYHLYLAMEEKEEKSAFKAVGLIKTFEGSFFRMSYTVHPSGIPGEAQGKSSNESWAAKQASRDYPEDWVKRNVIMTVMDADTHLSSRYFSQIARMHVEHAATNESTIYVPPLVFDRNLHNVPLPVRTADLMWAGAGISSLYAGSTICIPTSVYSLPMTLVEHVGGWDTGPGAIGEDMHMYLKCFFALSGHLEVRIVYAAASQCNVSSDERGLLGFATGLQARYKQALRHMWGALDTGYTIRQTVSMLKRHRVASRGPTDLPLSAPNSNWTAFYTSTGLHKSMIPKIADTEYAPPKPINWYNLCVLYHRMFEAHFLPVHLCVILITSGIYTLFTPTFLVPTAFKMALDFSSLCRLIGWCTMLCYFYLFERYHKLCVGLRQEEMRQAGLLEDMEDGDGFTPGVFQFAGLFEAALFPIGGVIFGAIPAIQAELSHLFTERLTYVVSLKPTLQTVRSIRGTRAMTP